MFRLFLVSDDNDFAEWIEEELAEYGRFVRTLDSLDFFHAQWNSTGGADVVIVTESAITTDESFMKHYQTVKLEAPETIFLMIYSRDDDEFIQNLLQTDSICVSYNDLDTGLLEERLRLHREVTVPKERIKPSPEKPAPKEETQTPRPPEPAPVEAETEETEETEQANKKKRSAEEQKAKLQKIKERIIIEEKIVTVHVPVHFNSLLVSIVSLYPRAGATFLTANFARMLGENNVPVSVLEPVINAIPSTYYDLLYGEKNSPPHWQPWCEELTATGQISKKNEWFSNGVNWIPSSLNQINGWDEDKSIKLLLAARKYPVTLCDISSNYQETQCKRLLQESDEIWIVMDGDPIQLGRHIRSFEALKKEYPNKNLRVIGNRWGGHIKNSEWKKVFSVPTLALVPDLGPAVVKHLWNGRLAWDELKLKQALYNPFKPMARLVVAKEIYSLLKLKVSIFQKVKELLQTKLEDENTEIAAGRRSRR